MFLFPKFSFPNWKLSFFFKINCLRQHVHTAISQQFYTLGRLLCKTIHSIRSLHLKTNGNRQLPKNRDHSYFQRKKHLMQSASDGEDGRAIPVLIWSHTNGKIMARPTTSTVSKRNCLAYKRELRWRKTRVRVHRLKIHVTYPKYTTLLKG